MSVNTEDHVELTPKEARGAGVGRHVFIILGVSTVLAAIALGLFFLGAAGAT